MKEYDLNQLSILVVESNSFLRLTIKNILRTLGVQNIIDATDLKAGWEAFRSNDPDVVLIDWSPNFNGLKLLNRIRNDPGSINAFVPVIIATSMTEVHNVVTARDSGTTDFLAKPLSPKTVYDHICSICDHPQPFVRTGNFFGPNRRRRHANVSNDRRQADAKNLNQSETCL